MPDLYSIDPLDPIHYSHSKGEIFPIDYHLHDGFEIFFFISGDVNYFIEKKVHTLKYGDLIITNNYEVHTPSFKSDKEYERIFLQFKPEIPERFSSPQFNLLGCFLDRPLGMYNKTSLGKKQCKELMRLFRRIEDANNSDLPGSEILRITSFIELLVFINRVFKIAGPAEEHHNVPKKLMPILDYIDDNLESELTLELLQEKFYINRFYLSRLFKESTGINIHEYITYKRISKAKRLLSEGYSVTDSCMISGFVDYSNFIRIFKKTVGVPPGQYKKLNFTPLKKY